MTSNHHNLSLVCYFLLLLHLTSALSPAPAPTSPPAQPPSPSSWDDENDNDYVYTPTPPPPPPAQCNPDDRNTLLRIKQALNNTVALSSWIPNTDCCNINWEFVACDESTGRVTVLHFYGNGWRSRNDIPRVLPTEVGDLIYLESLSFYNLAVGPIPRALVRLQRLKRLLLSHNRFTGRVPSFLSRMQSLSNLEIGGSELSGPVPSFFGQMQSLTLLDLNGNKLTGSIPSSLADAPKLYTIKLNNNKLTGRIPERLGHFKNVGNYVINLNLDNNKLSGPIPRSFGDVNFRSLFLNDNKLTGDASFVFGKEKRVWLIDLSSNKLSFNMSRVEIPPQLSWIGLSHNKIYGSLPQELTKNRLDYFNVSYNGLCGPIPVGGWLQKFNETAYFHNKCLCGAPLAPCM